MVHEAQDLILLLIAAISSLLISPIPATSQEPKPPTSQTSGGGANAAEPSFRVVRSVSGSKILDQGGRYSIEDPRTVFYAPDDKQVVVYFTWEGPAGSHHFEVIGKIQTQACETTEFDTGRINPFGAYFKMLQETTPPTAHGHWKLGSWRDAGSHTFQITLATRPDH